jgi:DNA polymerase III delta prime subunit
MSDPGNPSEPDAQPLDDGGSDAEVPMSGDTPSDEADADTDGTTNVDDLDFGAPTAVTFEEVDDRSDAAMEFAEAIGAEEVALVLAHERISVDRVDLNGGPDYALLASDFAVLAKASGVSLSLATTLDLLTAYLSCQFVLFAGPSGTGKSTAARLLGEYFCTAGSFGRIEARRQMIGPEDVAGYLSPVLAGSYIRVPDLRALLSLARVGSNPPCLLVEEVNLSPVEGYLAPWVHGLSAPSNAEIDWPLYETDARRPPGIPDHLVFRPYPRLLGTINVDATAPAPARKVASRACVVLLRAHPVNGDDVVAAMASLDPSTAKPAPTSGAAAGWPDDPARILIASDPAAKERIAKAIFSVLGDIAPSSTAVPHRQLHQMILYVSWFDKLAEGVVTTSGDRLKAGAVNAFLHFVLPTLSAGDLDTIAGALRGIWATDHDTTWFRSSVLDSVLPLLTLEGDALGLARLLDFWDRLS